jgi:Kef-type K+ transport system membrane component KefB
MGPAYAVFGDIVRMLTMAGLSFIMIHVGYEFGIDKSNLKQYGWDYLIAFCAASFSWVFVTLYLTFISNLGKMFPAFCNRSETPWRERLSLAIGMWPRGEVGAGVLVISMSYGIGGPIVTIAMLSLALNLLLTGVFIYFVKRLTRPLPAYDI